MRARVRMEGASREGGNKAFMNKKWARGRVGVERSTIDKKIIHIC